MLYFNILISFLDEYFSEESDEEDESDNDDIKLPGNLNSSRCYYFLSIKTICIYIKKNRNVCIVSEIRVDNVFVNNRKSLVLEYLKAKV